MDLDSVASRPSTIETPPPITSSLSLVFALIGMGLCCAGVAVIAYVYSASPYSAESLTILGGLGAIGAIVSGIIAIPFGIIGIVRNERQRVIALIGIVLGAVPSLSLCGLIVYGLYLRR